MSARRRNYSKQVYGDKALGGTQVRYLPASPSTSSTFR